MYAIGLNQQYRRTFYSVNVNTCTPSTDLTRPGSKVVLFQVKVSFNVVLDASVISISKSSFLMMDVALLLVNSQVPLVGQMGKPFVAVKPVLVKVTFKPL